MQTTKSLYGIVLNFSMPYNPAIDYQKILITSTAPFNLITAPVIPPPPYAHIPFPEIGIYAILAGAFLFICLLSLFAFTALAWWHRPRRQEKLRRSKVMSIDEHVHPNSISYEPHVYEQPQTVNIEREETEENPEAPPRLVMEKRGLSTDKKRELTDYIKYVAATTEKAVEDKNPPIFRDSQLPGVGPGFNRAFVDLEVMFDGCVLLFLSSHQCLCYLLSQQLLESRL